jgi:hypothetical protein
MSYPLPDSKNVSTLEYNMAQQEELIDSRHQFSNGTIPQTHPLDIDDISGPPAFGSE